MLISCTSCQSKYLVNSADLKPDGRTVQCAKCNFKWFQKVTNEEELTSNLTNKIDNVQHNQKKKPVANFTTKSSSLSIAPYFM